MKATRGDSGRQSTRGTQHAAVKDVAQAVVVDGDKVRGEGTAYKTGHGSATGPDNGATHTGEYPGGGTDPGP